MLVFNVVKQLPGSTRFFFSCSCPSTSLGHLLMFEALKADGHYLAAQNAFGKPRDFLGPGPLGVSTTEVNPKSHDFFGNTGLGTRFSSGEWVVSYDWGFVESNLTNVLIFFFPNGLANTTYCSHDVAFGFEMI